MYKKILIISVLLLLPYQIASGLTFKSDGTVVQKSGEVISKSFGQRFGEQFFNDAPNWPRATGTGQDPAGYLGDNFLLPGTPLLVVQNIKKGDSYVDALMVQNGFASKSSLQRFIVGNANPQFMRTLGLSETQAVAYVAYVDPDLIEGLSNEYQSQLSIIVQEVEDAVGESVEKAIEESVEQAVSDALDASLDAWWDATIQELLDAGYTIIWQEEDPYN